MLDFERKRIYKDMIVDPAERERVANALIALRGKKLEHELTYDEYAERLKPFTKESGVFPVQIATTVGALKIQYQPTFVLNMVALIPNAPGTQYTPLKPNAKANTVETETFGHKRECPKCEGEIDARATFCRHCQSRVAEQISCPHCGEAKVTTDAAECWRCGKQMPVLKPQLTCQSCYSFKGTEDEFPCKVCGYALDGNGGEKAETEKSTEADQKAAPDWRDNAAAESDLKVKASSAVGEEQQEEKSEAGRTPEEPEPEASATESNYEKASDEKHKQTTVVCSSCYCPVQIAPRCSVCNAPLDMN